VVTLGTEYIKERREDDASLDDRVETYSIYAQDEYQIYDPLYMALSARWDHYSDFGSELTPRISMTYAILDNLISALTVALGGMIGWVGLVIPHIARMLVGPDNRTLLPVSAVIGAVYLLVVDDISRLAFTVEIPIGILTSLVGIPFFALILGKSRKGWS